MTILELDKVDIIFGDKPKRAFPMLDKGMDRETIRQELHLTIAARQVCLKIEEGEIFVLMGLSGSGKSTLLRTMNALCKPTRGRVLLNGVDVTTMNDDELRRVRTELVSMVFQSAALMPWRTVLDNAALGLELLKLPKNIVRERTMEALRLVGLQDWCAQYPDQLSGGMRQRVGIARALATGSQIILMDEPFSALDPLIRQQLQEELVHLQKDLKKTIVFVTHDLEEAMRLASRLAIIEDGEVVQVGTSMEILNNPADDYVRRFVSGIERSCPKCDALNAALDCGNQSHTLEPDLPTQV